VGAGGVPTVILSPSFLASAITSDRVFAGTEGLDMITIGTEAIKPTGAKSFAMS
jgi:hypothetical protein